MCFSQPGSLAFFALGAGTGLFLKARGSPRRRYQLFLYFALMELVQFGAYFFVDQCDNTWNKVFTMLAYAHVMFQNTFVNWYFLAPEFGVHRDVTKLVCTMCVIGGCMGCFLKTPWPVWLGAPVTMLDGLAKTLPDFFSFSTAGTPESCLYESMCGPKVCTFSTPNHIAWMVPIMPQSYYLTGGFLHFFFFFFPSWIMGNLEAKVTMILAFFTGPVLTQLLAAQYMDTYKFEWPATWCYMSVGQCFVALAVEFYSIHKQRQAAAAGAAGVVGNGKPVHTVTVNTALNGHDMDDIVAHGLPDTPGKPSKKKE